MPAVVLAQDVARWSASEIHDTVAAIARQPMYATSIRESILGRFFRFVIERLVALFRIFEGAGDPTFIIIVALAAAVVIIVARVIVTRRAADIQRRLGARGRYGRIAVRDYWTDARTAAQAGDYTAATHALYSAVVDSLAHAGLVVYHPSKTSGDYARELLRVGAAARQDFRAFARDADRVIYGMRRPDADDFQRLFAAAERATRRPAAA